MAWAVLFLLVCYVTSSEAFLLTHSYDLSRCIGHIPRSSHVMIYRSHCYQFVLDDKLSWEKASDACHKTGGHLVVIPDSNTQNFIMHALSALHFNGDAVWIGLSDSDSEHHFKWVTGARLSGYNHFAAGETSDSFLHWSQDCVLLRTDDHGLWHDHVCVWPETFEYICQYNMRSAPITRPTTTTPKTTTTTTTPQPTTTTTTRSTTPSTTTSTTTTTTTPVPTTTTRLTTTTTVPCQDIDCSHTCENGYSGIYVGPDGCIACRCN